MTGSNLVLGWLLIVDTSNRA